MSEPLPDPPPGLWEKVESLLRHERELWESGTMCLTGTHGIWAAASTLTDSDHDGAVSEQ